MMISPRTTKVLLGALKTQDKVTAIYGNWLNVRILGK